MNIRIHEGDLHFISLKTRMPFKYGIATMTEMPQVFVRLAVEVEGRQSLGVAADLLPPKWFTKDPARDVADEIKEMFVVVRNAVNLAFGLAGPDAFTVWKELYERQLQWARQYQLPPLLANLGTSLVERAMIDAICRVAGRPFHRLLHANHFGIQLGHLHPALGGRKLNEFLPSAPLPVITARHTVGLSDYLVDAEIPASEKVADGLPQSLEACISVYGLRHFKVKLGGQLEADLERLERIAAVIEKQAPADFAFTLDGNEQFKSFAEFRAFWEAAGANIRLKNFLRHLMFVEQPVHRAEALNAAVGEALAAWNEQPPLIIDESDATIESLPTALALGYSGTSHKNCKGIFKGIANCCLLQHHQQSQPEKKFLMSGEDLCNVGPVALLQDLNVMAALGIESVERNGHHYNAGLSQFPQAVQEQILRLHGDLYHASPAGWPTLTIRNGQIDLRSVNESPFGVRFLTDVEKFKKVEDKLFR